MKTATLKKLLLINGILTLSAGYYGVFIDNYVEPLWIFLAITGTNAFAFLVIYLVNRFNTHQNPFEHIKIEKNLFYINNHVFPLSEVSVVVVNKVDGEGLLQLPYTADGKICYRFDPAYIRKLQQFIAKKLPQAELVV